MVVMLYRRIAHNNTDQALQNTPLKTGPRANSFTAPPSKTESNKLLKEILKRNNSMLFSQEQPFNLFLVFLVLAPFSIFVYLAIHANQKG